MTVLMSDTDLRDRAAAARRMAGLLADVERDLQSRCRHVLWRGAGVESFHADRQKLAAGLDLDTGQLRQVAGLLEQSADALAGQRYALQGDQNVVEDLLRGSPDPAALLHRAGWSSTALPPAFDTEWKELARRVTAAVAHPTGTSG